MSVDVVLLRSAPMLSLLAPGAKITAAGISLSGTSQATPFVAAALALMRSRYPQYTMQQILDVLKSTGVPVSLGSRVCNSLCSRRSTAQGTTACNRTVCSMLLPQALADCSQPTSS